MKKIALIYFIALAAAAVFLHSTENHVEWARQLFASLVLTGFGFFAFIGHRLFAEYLIDSYDAFILRGKNGR